MGQQQSRSSSEEDAERHGSSLSKNGKGSNRKGKQGGGPLPLPLPPLPPVPDIGGKLAEEVKLQQEELAQAQAKLLAAERSVRDHMYGAYCHQLAGLAPTLRVRGEIVGDTLLDSLTGSGGMAAKISYPDIVSKSLKDLPIQHPVREILATMDPLLTPVLDPFVQGIKQPFIVEVEDVKNKVVWGWAASAVTCCAFGYALGRLSARDRGRGR